MNSKSQDASNDRISKSMFIPEAVGGCRWADELPATILREGGGDNQLWPHFS